MNIINLPQGRECIIPIPCFFSGLDLQQPLVKEEMGPPKELAQSHCP